MSTETDGGHPEQARIEAYLGSTMDGAERARFEGDAAADPTLAAEIAAWREALDAAQAWAHAPVPGAERVERLRAPRLGAGGRVVTIRATHPGLRFAGRLAWRAAALAAVFAAGYLVGAREVGFAGQAKEDSGIARPVAATPSASLPDEQSPGVLPEAAPDDPAPAPTYATEEGGRVIVQTTLPASGARVTWVVDSTFQIPGAEPASQL